MQINLKLPDNLYDTYISNFGSPLHYRKMKEAIESMRDVKDKHLILHGDRRREVEAVFETTMDSPEKLVKCLKNLATVKIGGVEVNFTADQLARIAMQATFHGRTTETYIKETVTELLQRFMEEV